MAGMGRPLPPQVLPKAGPQDIIQQQLQQDVQRQVSNLALTPPSTVLPETRITDNTVHLQAGDYPNFTQQKPGTQVVGQAGSQLGDITVTSTYTMANTRVKGTVLLKAGTKALFSNVRFDGVITCAKGAKASFSNCWFGPQSYIDNTLGVITDIGVSGHHESTTADINVTTLFSF